MHRRTKQLLWSIALSLGAGVAGAQTFPAKPVKIIVPFAAGGLTDVLTRGTGQELTRIWGQQVIVENRPGANTIIGAEITAKAPPDGYTLLMGNDPTVSSNQYLYSKLPYNPEKDFAPVVNLVALYSIVVASSSFPGNTLQDFIAEAKKRPGDLTYGTSGLGSKLHIDTEALSAMAGIKMIHVPYKGIAETIPAIISGQITMAMAGIQPSLTHLRNGRLKAFAIAAPRRSASLPDLPTFAEAGMPGYESRTWFGLLAPAATPRPVIDRIANSVKQAFTNKEFLDKFVIGVGMEPLVLLPDEFAEFLKADRVKYQQQIKAINVRLD